MNDSRSPCASFARVRFAIAPLVLALIVSPPVTHAAKFARGELAGSFDSSFSVGALYRLQPPDPALYGPADSFRGVAGTGYSVNGDDGDLNYAPGIVSELFKGDHELELKWRNVGAFARGYYFIDARTAHTRRTPLSEQARQRVVRGADLLDLYAVAKFDLGDTVPVDLRFGRQVLSLGESTFIPNGINIVNPVDLSKLRVPGAGLKEAFLPVNLLKASVALTPRLTIEPYWLLEFRRNELEPAGTYFSTTDVASRGGDKAYVGFGTLPDSGTLGALPRGHDRDAGNYNQFGASLRYFSSILNDSEFGLYFARYHSRSPVLSARTPTGPIDTALVHSTAASLANAQLAPALIAHGYPAADVPAALASLLGAAFANAPASALPAALQPFYPSAQTIATSAGKIGLLTATGTARYFLEYPEGIVMLGASFNSAIGDTGISWQGEVSYKHGVPLQIDDVELFFAALSAVNPVFGAHSQVGNYSAQYNKELSGYRRHDVWTAQTTLTQAFGPIFGSQQATLVGEIGGLWADLPDPSVLRYEAPGTYTSGSAAAMTATGFGAIPATPADRFANAFSWGYQLAARLDYNNVFAGLNISPTIAFVHDVSGNSPLPLANFVAHRRSLNLAVELLRQNAWAFEVRYVNFFGAGASNLLGDRDYVATTVKYSF